MLKFHSDDGGNDGRALALQIILSTDNNAINCIDACIAADPDTTAAGMEYGVRLRFFQGVLY